MKFACAILALVLTSCANDKLQAPSPVLGIWHVQSDQLNMGGALKQYSASTLDTYDFQSNGVLLVHEGNAIDTASYSLLQDSVVDIHYKKAVALRLLVMEQGVVVKDSIVNRFNARAKVTLTGAGSIRVSSSFNYAFTPPVAGSASSQPIQVPVSILIDLKR